MDPNATLQYLGAEMSRFLASARIREAVDALDEWMACGGFEPDWDAYPDGKLAYNILGNLGALAEERENKQ